MLFDMVNYANKLDIDKDEKELREISDLFFQLSGDVLGLELTKSRKSSAENESKLLDLMLKLRSMARERKDWESADLIRDQLDKLGYEIRDGKQGTTWVKKS